MSVDISNLPIEYRQIYEQFIMSVDTNIDLSKVILSKENKDKIDLFIQEMKFKDTFYKYGLEPSNRILMYGASGTGKTHTTKALSNELGYTMVYIDIARALTDDNVAKNISEIFKLTNYLGNCLLMLDECDSIAWQRDTGNSDTGKIRRATNSLFQQLDQMNHSNVFIAATNMLHKLDPAFARRFDLKMEFTRPKFELKKSIEQFMVPGFKLVDDVDDTTCEIVDRSATQNTKLSYYEIKNLVERAAKDSIINGKREVCTSRIYKDLAEGMHLKLRFNINDDYDDNYNAVQDDKYNQ